MIYYEEERLRLLVGDARELAAEIEPGSVDCIVTSPPYWDVRDYQTGAWEGGDPSCEHLDPGAVNARDSRWKQHTNKGTTVLRYRDVCADCGAKRVEDEQLGHEATSGEFIEKLVQILGAFRPTLAETGVLWLNLGDKIDAEPAGVPWRAVEALRESGWALRRDVIWHKTNPFPESITTRPATAHEYVYLLSGPRWSYIHRGKTRLRSVWTGPTAGYGGNHHAVMPLWLAERAILHTTKPGALVLDPFCGTGTSLIAARRNGRRAVGIDLSLDSLGQALRRIRDET